MTQEPRVKPLHKMFTMVPRRYDLINHVATWNLDKRWRRLTAKECLRFKPRNVLDLCCGTGDLAIYLGRFAESGVEVVGLDYSEPMLAIANRKAERQLAGRKIPFVYGDAASLPFPDARFDCIGISFAFRNLMYKNPLAQQHLAEVLRVLVPGGRYVIVETSQPKSRLVRGFFHLYLRWFVFPMGYWLSGNRGAYHYLTESAARFYPCEEVKAMLLKAGFCEVSSRRLFLGAVAIYVATK